MWANTVELGRWQMTIWFMCIACWITKATNTHSEYVTLIDFSAGTVVARMCFSMVSYVHCWSSLKMNAKRLKWSSVYSDRILLKYCINMLAVHILFHNSAACCRQQEDHWCREFGSCSRILQLSATSWHQETYSLGWCNGWCWSQIWAQWRPSVLYGVSILYKWLMQRLNKTPTWCNKMQIYYCRLSLHVSGVMRPSSGV